MMKTSLLLILLAVVLPGTPVIAEGEIVSPGQTELQVYEQKLASIKDPAAKLFFKAGLQRYQGRPEEALKTLAELIVHYFRNEKWIARSELMSAELYMELDMLDAADVTARQIQKLYEGADIADKATALRSKIEKLKADKESEGSAQ